MKYLDTIYHYMKIIKDKGCGAFKEVEDRADAGVVRGCLYPVLGL